jgi:phage shock protein PspC (stress-responsive transcriptional regulator)
MDVCSPSIWDSVLPFRAGTHILFMKNHLSGMKRLYRSTTERILGGVCGGIGIHLDVDPIIIRIIWIVLTCISLGIGIIAYLVCWVIIPEEPHVQNGNQVHG